MISKTARLCVTDNQYWIHGDVFDVTEWRYMGFNGLVASIAAPGVLRDPGDFAIVMTGTESGPVSVTVQADAHEPGPADPDAWDEVVEVSLLLPGDKPAVVTDFDDDESSSLPALTVLGPGPYRVRVHARGRDAGQEALMVEDEPVEEHLIQVWPAPAAPTQVIKTSDTYGMTFRSQN
ncbi:hypothetical protein [Streptomyces sp. NPDC093261]|uniref:hypothetical protein n=1 Tax=Streptomyces sp. NPDC093261 TaxID=3366037 RepID=UPI00381B2915